MTQPRYLYGGDFFARILCPRICVQNFGHRFLDTVFRCKSKVSAWWPSCWTIWFQLASFAEVENLCSQQHSGKERQTSYKKSHHLWWLRNAFTTKRLAIEATRGLENKKFLTINQDFTGWSAFVLLLHIRSPIIIMVVQFESRLICKLSEPISETKLLLCGNEGLITQTV